MLTRLIILLSFFFINIIGFSQDFAWVKKITDQEFPTYGRGLSIDIDGNVYTIGIFEGPIDLDPNNGELIFTAADFSTNDNDLFIQKLTPHGELIWAKTFEGPGNCYGNSIKIINDIIYIYGTAYENVDFDPNENQVFLSTNQDEDIFILKMSLDGELIWVRNFGSGGQDNIYGLDVDENGNVYSTGYFYGNVDFNPGEEQMILSSEGISDKSLFIQKLDINGNFLWAKQVDGNITFQNTYNHLVAYNNHVAITGSFYSSIDFNPGNGIHMMGNSDGAIDMFLLQLSSNGGFEWGRYIDCEDISRGSTIAADNNNNLLVNSVIKGPAILSVSYENITLDTGNEKDIVLQKINENGEIIWNKTIGNNISDSYYGDFFIDINNNLYLFGLYEGSIDVDPSEDIYMLEAETWRNNYILKLNTDGLFQWVKEIDLMGNPIIGNAHKGIAVDQNLNVITMGVFVNNASFNIDNDPIILHEYNSGYGSIYIHKLSNCVNSRIDTISTCEPYTWIDGNTYTENSIAKYYAEESTTNSCDSIVTLILEMPHIDAIVYIDDFYHTLTSAESEGVYQWYLCLGDSLVLLEGENNRDLDLNGDDTNYYSVAITQHNCTEYTECISMGTDGINDINSKLLIFPNPTTDMLTINSSFLGSSIKIINPLGKLIKEREFKKSSMTLDLSHLASGIYFIQLLDNKQVIHTKKIILE